MEAADNGSSVILGDANFDLAYYANNPEINQDKLPLKKCEVDSEAFIQIHIKTNSSEVLMKSQPQRSEAQGGSTPGQRSVSPQSGVQGGGAGGKYGLSQMNSQLNQIDERTSEGGYKEGLDRKEFMYQEQIQNLKSRVADIQMITKLTQEEIENMRKQNEDVAKNQELLALKTKQADLFKKKDEGL